MKLGVALVTLLAVAACNVSALPTDVASGRIIGGVNALPGEFPEICLIQWVFLNTQSNVCACTIIAPNFVVTAGHCITEAPTTGRLEVLGGVLDHTVIAQQRQRIGVMIATVHPDYVASAEGQPRQNDIAILRLQSPFSNNEWIRPATLPVSRTPTGVTMMAGWGQTGTGILPPSATFLQMIRASVLEWNECRAAVSGAGIVLQEAFMCTGTAHGATGTCNGDAGGPVLQDGVLLGVISKFTCGTSASVHVNVGYYVDWLQGIMG